MTDIHEQIAAMHDTGLDIGTLIEITLKQGVVWNNGHTDAPTIDPCGYEAPKNNLTPPIPGATTVGYISGLTHLRVTLAPTLGKTNRAGHFELVPDFQPGHCYVHGDAIYSVRKC